MRVKFSDPGNTLPLYTRDPFEPVHSNDMIDQLVGTQRRALARDVPKPPSSSKRSRILDIGVISSPLPTTRIKEEDSAVGNRRRSNRIVGSQNVNGNQSSPASQPRQHHPSRISGYGSQSSTRHSDRLLDSSLKTTAAGNAKYTNSAISGTTPALVRFAEELPRQQQRITVDHIGDDQYVVTGNNWRWETSFPVETSGELRTLIQTFEGDTSPILPPAQPFPHLARGGALPTSEQEFDDPLEDPPELTNGSSPPHQPSPSPPPRSTPKPPIAPRPSSGRVLKPTAKLREMEATRHPGKRVSRERSSSTKADPPPDTQSSEASQSNASGLKIQLRKISPVPSGIKLCLKQNGAKAKSRHVLGHNDFGGSDDDDDEIVVQGPSKRAKVGRG